MYVVILFWLPNLRNSTVASDKETGSTLIFQEKKDAQKYVKNNGGNDDVLYHQITKVRVRLFNAKRKAK